VLRRRVAWARGWARRGPEKGVALDHRKEKEGGRRRKEKKKGRKEKGKREKKNREKGKYEKKIEKEGI
jgi:hypothetical protein